MLDSERSGNPKIRSMPAMDFGFHGLVGLLILIGDIWAIINILQSSASNEKKILWVVVVALLPLIGLILWYFMGPRTGKP
jgi:succinate dehydrogenase/fumarate reductase cytochrome b subunit